MIYTILYVLLAALALGILIFLHELGHYILARRQGMRVEAFSIGFGRPIVKWERDGVEWQISWIPFGGFVKIAGMEKQGVLEPYQIEDGFYGKSPWSRIKVALAGPLVNIFVAFLLFSVIWLSGGRDKSFSECTHLVGWVQPGSPLYKEGMRAGDQINTYGNESFTGFRQFATSALLDEGPYSITGERFNYLSGTVSPFAYSLNLGDTLSGLDKMSLALRMIAPAQYLIYNKSLGSLDESPMESSGIQSGDRVLWVDGDLIYSRKNLSGVINDSKALLTVARGEKVFSTRIPRMHIRDLRFSSDDKAELQDVSYALKITAPFAGRYFIPYMLSDLCVVERSIPYIDDLAHEKKSYDPIEPSSIDQPLQVGDRVLSIDGSPVESLQQAFSSLQTKKVQMVVVRDGKYPSVSAQAADEDFMKNISFKDLDTMVASIGTQNPIQSMGNLYMLSPVTPVPRNQFSLTHTIKDRVKSAVVSQKKKRQGLDEGASESVASLKSLEASQQELMLGLPLEDRLVKYNPSPLHLMAASFQEAWKMIYALVTGYASPKYLAGPVGIVQVIHYGWAQGLKEALYLVAAISFNLGLVNLLPVPVLDGGHICFALYEMITRKRIKAKTMERMIIPFIILFVAFFIYLTYQDLYRLIGRFF